MTRTGCGVVRRKGPPGLAAGRPLIAARNVSSQSVASARENISGSTFPPEISAITVSPSSSSA